MEKEIIPTKHGDYTIKIIHDDDPQNPRRDWDPFGHMICFHRRYDLGDKHTHSDVEEFLRDLSQWDDEKDFDYAEAYAIIMENNVILPLYLYDHSGITMSTGSFGDRWDSGQVGWIYASKKDVCENWGVKDWEDMVKNNDGEMLSAKEYAKVLLEGEVETYDKFITGEVYGFKVIDPDGEDIHSCWGFFGDTEKSGLLDDANSYIQYDVKKKDKQEAEDLHKIGCLVFSERF